MPVHEKLQMLEKTFWIDHVRCIACLLVVLLHTAAPYLYTDVFTAQWQTANWIDSFTRTSVPLFFMVSGYLFFHDKHPKFKNYLKIIAALSFYSAIYMALQHYESPESFDLTGSIKTSLHRPVYYHLWFFYSILIIYAFANLFQVRQAATPMTVALVFLLLFLHFNPATVQHGPINGIAYYVLYGVLGAHIGASQPKTERSKAIFWFAITLFIACSCFIAYKTHALSHAAKVFIDDYYSYISIPVAIGSICLFTAIRRAHVPLRRYQYLVELVSKNSLGIYGIHAFFLWLFQRESIQLSIHPFFNIIFSFVAIFLLSLLFSMAMKIVDKKGYVS